MNAAALYTDSTKPAISFEFFPPRNEQAAAKFDAIIDKLAGLGPEYFSVTFA